MSPIDLFAIEKQLVVAVASVLEIDPDSVNPLLSFDILGLDSMSKVSIVLRLERHFGCELDPEALFEFTNIRDLAAHIQGVLSSHQNVVSNDNAG